jgi:shikimate dehydrogenase
VCSSDLWAEDGWHGFNTDGYGLATALRETLRRDLRGTDILILGAGGAARGAAVECLQRGCRTLWIANRTAANLAALIAAVSPAAGPIPVRGFAPDAPPADFPAGTIVINATSAGLRDTDPAPINLADLPRPACIYDMIYNPPRTRLLLQAEALGLPCANGLTMLVHQGAKALEIWTGAPAGATAPAMAAALQARP